MADSIETLVITDPKAAEAWGVVGEKVTPILDSGTKLGKSFLAGTIPIGFRIGGLYGVVPQIEVPVSQVFKSELPETEGWYYIRNNSTGKITPCAIEPGSEDESDILITCSVGPRIPGC